MIHAIYQDGVFRPTSPVDLPEGSEVTIQPKILGPEQPDPNAPPVRPSPTEPGADLRHSLAAIRRWPSRRGSSSRGPSAVRPVFLDTVGLIALWERADQWHASAARVFQSLLRAGVPVVATPHILWEAGNASARRPCRADVAVLRRELLVAESLITPTPWEEEAAWVAYERGEAGVVDQISFAVMRRLELTQAFTNDAHYRAAGFVTLF